MTDKFARISMIDGYEREFISRLKILVVGAGAVGNEIIKNLTLFGVGHVSVIDFDTIEIHNLTRSVFFRERDVGNGKAETVAKRAKDLSPDTDFTSIHGDVWDVVSLRELRTFDMLVCSVDNFEARIKINTMAGLAGVPLLNTGIDHRSVSLELFPFGFAKECGCFECSLPQSVYEKISERYSCGWIKKIYQEEKVVPTTPVTASVVGGMSVSIILEFLKSRSLSEVPSAKKIYFDTRSSKISQVTQARKESCPSPVHRSKELKIKTVERDFHQTVEQGLGAIPHELYVQFSDPILLRFEKKGEIHGIVFDVAGNHDETALLVDGKRVLDPIICDGLTFSDLTNNYQEYKIPCKFIILQESRLFFDLLLEFKG